MLDCHLLVMGINKSITNLFKTLLVTPFPNPGRRALKTKKATYYALKASPAGSQRLNLGKEALLLSNTARVLPASAKQKHIHEISCRPQIKKKKPQKMKTQGGIYISHSILYQYTSSTFSSSVHLPPLPACYPFSIIVLWPTQNASPR